MKKFNRAIIIVSIIAMLLAGCGAKYAVRPAQSETSTSTALTEPTVSSGGYVTPGSSSTTGNSALPERPQDAVLVVVNKDEIKNELMHTIKRFAQLPVLDVSKCDLGSEPDLTLINIYYDVISEQPELKYAYKMTPDYQAADKLIASEIKYMPFKNDNFPVNFSGNDICSYEELIKLAESELGQDPISIRITNSRLDVDTMNRSLQQVGGGYVICGLNVDATKIVFQPVEQRTMAECLDFLSKVDKMAYTIIAKLVRPEMNDKDNVLAIYSYLTSHVKYDQRYYSDPASMSFESRTAYGALKDGLAICGGYAHALKLLLNKTGIECYSVSGVSHGENHAWNVALVNGQWIYFDATFDRGSGGDSHDFRYFGVGRDVMEIDHSWDWCLADTFQKVD